MRRHLRPGETRSIMAARSANFLRDPRDNKRCKRNLSRGKSKRVLKERRSLSQKWRKDSCTRRTEIKIKRLKRSSWSVRPKSSKRKRKP